MIEQTLKKWRLILGRDKIKMEGQSFAENEADKIMHIALPIGKHSVLGNR